MVICLSYPAPDARDMCVTNDFATTQKPRFFLFHFVFDFFIFFFKNVGFIFYFFQHWIKTPTVSYFLRETGSRRVLYALNTRRNSTLLLLAPDMSGWYFNDNTRNRI